MMPASVKRMSSPVEPAGKQVFAIVLFLVLGAATGYIYLLLPELLLLVLLVLIAAMALGAWQLKKPWLPALLLTAGVLAPVVTFHRRGDPSDTSPMSSVLIASIVAALLGACGGHGAAHDC